MKEKMIAYCGLVCEKCDAYIATINNDDVLREKTAKFWAELNNAPITAEMINCMGCRMDGVKTPFCDSMCQVRQCAIKNEVDSCGDCAETSSCEIIGKILNNSKEAE